MTAHSATLAIDEAVRARRAAGLATLHLGFGEAGLPVAPGLTEVLAASAGRSGYGPVVGSPEAREAAAGWFGRRGLATEPEQVLFAPGSKPLLFALLAALEGDVVLPRPSWVSYTAQAALLGRRVIEVPIPADAGGIPAPELLELSLRRAEAAGARPGVLVLTVPDNPTGTVADEQRIASVLAVAARRGLTVISDEIYAELGHRGPVPSPATLGWEQTVVTSGLSKSLAVGGWRVGFARLPAGPWGRRLGERLTGIASEIWSSLAAPMQAVAVHALREPPEITAYVTRARQLHARVAEAAHTRLVAAGARCRPPRGGFYLYPDFAPVGRPLRARGVTTSAALATTLLERHGVAALPGSAFGDPASTLTLRIATGLLYGETERDRLAALASPEPEGLPWIDAALRHLGDALAAVTARPGAQPRDAVARAADVVPD
ncbi:pyridoxal phosphate-dependent aminotransferase [Streptomyces profundus]|uniref:pyridoxal phosphate-dependent aminotransferase n=1 Tax=Streptomyces profundus TaxID=2867410 RepID=UPI001D16B505|nr:pyridoxal phosphate-dependent aminotransferase [Streptomyces sp. MA3_2.13]UED87782.1 pyridoxal phosphate-dependent aminotransferase [Streptomyces sp. MA3_2.13]